MRQRLDAELEQGFTFGPFVLLPRRKVLMKGEVPVPLGSRAMDILTLLVEQAGRTVSKEAFFAYAWPQTHVEETNLRVHVAALRKALEDRSSAGRYIVNVPGRGYMFTAAVSQLSSPGVPGRPQKAAALPVRLTRMIGREAAVKALCLHLASQRIITIVGTGGIGKTSVALAVARELAEAFPHGAHFVDLGPLADAALVPTALASALGLSVFAADPLPDLMAFLQDRSMLILLDNCEHMVAAAAALVEAILHASPGTKILATSREPLRLDGEWVYRLAAMDVPAAPAGLDAARALAFSAIELFVERADAASGGFTLTDENAADIAALCRRLDGLPLAIELTAARVERSGVRNLASRLDDRLLLNTQGRRTALARQQTLYATLDWSYGLLTPKEQAALRVVSIFSAGFNADSGMFISRAIGLDDHEFVDAIESLSEKSLVQMDVGGPNVGFRLLESARAFAAAKLREAGEEQLLARQHATYFLHLLIRAESDWDEMNAAEWLALYGPAIDDVRAALRWALSPSGDHRTALALTAAAVPLWMHLSLTLECGDAVARVLARPDDAAPREPAEQHRRMKLLNALGLSLLYTKGPGPQIEAALNGAREMAEALGEVDYQLRSLWGLFVAAFNEANPPLAFERATIFCEIAKRSSNPHDLRAGERLLGFALHLLGRQAEARSYIENMLAAYVAPSRRSDYVRFQYDQRVAARVPLSAILCLQGEPKPAMDMAAQAVDDALAIGHGISLGYALSTAACPTSFFVGDLAAAERYVGMLVENVALYGLGPWSVWGRYFKGLLRARRGELELGLEGMGAALCDLQRAGFALRLNFFQGEYAALLGQAGKIQRGLEAVEVALGRCRDGQENWCLPELLRVKGELLCRADPGAADAADALFDASLTCAEQYGMYGWSLRTGLSLARLRRAQGRAAEGQLLLASICARFVGQDSADLRAAREMLA